MAQTKKISLIVVSKVKAPVKSKKMMIPSDPLETISDKTNDTRYTAIIRAKTQH